MSKKLATTDNTKKSTVKAAKVTKIAKASNSVAALPALVNTKSTELEIVDRVLNRGPVLPTTTSQDPLTQYVKEISRYKLLTIEEEEMLIKEMKDSGDIEVAKKLVLANLRLVVKIALEYRSAWQNVMDLIQEGNIGLMKAVSKYDSTKGAKLSYYASWWIRSYILKFILDNFRLVKIGTTNEQKKLFFNLLKEKERLIGMGINPDNKMISSTLGVSEKSVAVMDRRLGSGGSELSIEARLDDDGPSLGDSLTNQDEIPVDERLGDLQGVEILRDHLKSFLADLKERDREIFEKRLLSEVPASLQSIADQYGVSRERIRQIEERLINNLKVYMSEFIR
ncbi:MAG: RNA polymerase factor sigma-32 [Bacteriovorax sp.]|nr:RNA polymerase factor sigma-32 [Bacteriovorax sp.]